MLSNPSPRIISAKRFPRPKAKVKTVCAAALKVAEGLARLTAGSTTTACDTGASNGIEEKNARVGPENGGGDGGVDAADDGVASGSSGVSVQRAAGCTGGWKLEEMQTFKLLSGGRAEVTVVGRAARKSTC